MNHRKLHHLCIQTDDYEASLRFYVEILEFKVVKETPNFHNRHFNTWIEYGDIMIELQTNRVDETLIPQTDITRGLAHFCFIVEDLEREYLRIKQLKHPHFKSKNGEELYTVNGSKLMKLVAPEGTVIEFRDRQVIK